MKAGKLIDAANIAAIDALQHRAFEREALWDKLQERIGRQRPRRILPSYFRWIAACLLLATGIIALLQQAPGKAQELSYQLPAFKINSEQQAIAPVIIVSAPAITTKQTVNAVRREPTATTPMHLAIAEENRDLPIATAETTSVLIPAANVQPAKRTIVYNNELTLPAAAEPVASGQSTPVSLPSFLKPGSERTYKTDGAEPSGNSYKKRWLPFNKNALPKEKE